MRCWRAGVLCRRELPPKKHSIATLWMSVASSVRHETSVNSLALPLIATRATPLDIPTSFILTWMLTVFHSPRLTSNEASLLGHKWNPALVPPGPTAADVSGPCASRLAW